MTTFYLALTLVTLPATPKTVPRDALAYKAYDTVQEACAAVAKVGKEYAAGELLIAQVENFTAQECCARDYTDVWLEACKKEPERFVCEAGRVVTALKCVASPAYQAVAP